MAAGAAMVVSLALKPYQGKIAPYVKKIKESSIANVSFDRATSDKHSAAADSHQTEEVEHKDKPKDKLTEKDKTQLKNVLEKL